MNPLPLCLNPIAWIAVVLLVRGSVVLVRDGVWRKGPRHHAVFLLGLGSLCLLFLAVTATPTVPLGEETLRRSLASTRLVDMTLR